MLPTVSLSLAGRRGRYLLADDLYQARHLPHQFILPSIPATVSPAVAYLTQSCFVIGRYSLGVAHATVFEFPNSVLLPLLMF